MGAAVHAPERGARAAAARRLQHERKRHRRPADRHGGRSAEHPVRRRDGDQQGGQRVHRSPGAVRSRRRRRLRHRRAGDDLHGRPRAHQAGAGADGRPEAGGPLGRRRPQHRAGRSAGDRPRRSGDRSSRCRAASAPPWGTSPGALDMCRGQVEMEARSLAFDVQPRRRSDDPDAARSVCRPADHRRAENADPDLRRVRAVERRADHRARHAGGRSAHQPVRAEAR